ncbi:unnamed protein product [Aphanomyces euteiches]
MFKVGTFFRVLVVINSLDGLLQVERSIFLTLVYFLPISKVRNSVHKTGKKFFQDIVPSTHSAFTVLPPFFWRLWFINENGSV